MTARCRGFKNPRPRGRRNFARQGGRSYGLASLDPGEPTEHFAFLALYLTDTGLYRTNIAYLLNVKAIE